MFYLSFSLLGYLLWLSGSYCFHKRYQKNLKDINPNQKRSHALVSVIVPIRNEASILEKSLHSLLEQKDVQLEIIAVDDRSTDNSFKIIEQMAKKYPQIKPLQIKTLPSGWLGKCHALEAGRKVAQGEYFVFSDADMIYEKECLQRAILFLEKEKADHICLFPRLITRDFWEAVMNSFLMFSMHLRFQMWRVNRGKSYCGVGAFQMLRKSVLEKLGGFSKLRLEVLDDMGLAYLIYQAGFRSRLAYADDFLSLSYSYTGGWRGFLKGLEKNAFAALHFSGLQLIISILFILWFSWGPWIGLMMAPSNTAGLFHILVLLIQIGTIKLFLPRQPLGHTFFFPLAALYWIVIFLYSAYRTWNQGGIFWRETFYPLPELKKGIIRP